MSHSGDLCACLGLADADIVPANYPEHDLLKLRFADNSFDWVIADQVIEHVAGDPDLAVEEVRRVLRPGGVMVMTSCLMNPIHNEPGDFWRFTPYGLRLLARNFESVLTAEGWGNPYVFMLWLLDMRFEGVPETRWHPLRRIAEMRHPSWFVSTWVVARK